MKRQCLSCCIYLAISFQAAGQSLELMPGTERIFVDVQWFKPIGKAAGWTVFSRTRATVDYENNSNVFTAAYLNYTTRTGFGVTALGRISSNGNGVDIGPHFFRVKGATTVFAIISFGLKDELEYSWFSIVRYRPRLAEGWKWYTSVELFSSFNRGRHQASVQRLRLGADRNGYQFGFGFNFNEFGDNFTFQENIGIFVRREF